MQRFSIHNFTSRQLDFNYEFLKKNDIAIVLN